MAYDTLMTESMNQIGWITVNRPNQLNALNADVLRDLTDAVKAYSNDPAVRVIVLTGAGNKAFIAGADIKAMAAMNMRAGEEFVRLGHTCMNAIDHADKPVIAMVNGFALGGGFEVALACDFIYASDNACLGLPEVSLGLFPGFGGTQRLRWLVGKGKATELTFTGRQLKADEAKEWGIVNCVCPQAELKACVEKTAAAMAKNSPVAIRTAKRLILKGFNLGLAGGMEAELTTFPQCFNTADCKEGLAAFLEKRTPNFEGK